MRIDSHSTFTFTVGDCCVFFGSPFEVEVGEEAGFQKVRAWGPGLKTGMVGKSADFVVEAIGTDVGTLGKSWISAEKERDLFNARECKM